MNELSLEIQNNYKFVLLFLSKLIIFYCSITYITQLSKGASAAEAGFPIYLKLIRTRVRVCLVLSRILPCLDEQNSILKVSCGKRLVWQFCQDEQDFLVKLFGNIARSLFLLARLLSCLFGTLAPSRCLSPLPLQVRVTNIHLIQEDLSFSTNYLQVNSWRTNCPRTFESKQKCRLHCNIYHRQPNRL